MLGWSSFLVAESENRYPRQHERNGKEPVGACPEPMARSRLSETRHHELDRSQEEPSDEEYDKPERNLERESKKQSRLKGGLKRKALGTEAPFEQLGKEKRQRRKDEEDG